MTSDSAATGERPLTVLIGADTFAPDVNGAARFAERLAAGLAARGHDVHVMAPSVRHRDGGARIEIIDGEPVTVHRAPSWRWYPHEWLRFVLPWRSRHYARAVLDAVLPDVVHSQSHIVVGRGLTLEAGVRGIPVVATNHVMPENLLDFTLLPEALNRMLLSVSVRAAARTLTRSRAITTPTPRAAEFLERMIGVDGVIPVSCGIDRSRYRPDLEPRSRAGILFVGRLTAEKQIDVLLRGFALVDHRHDAVLELVGEGDQRRALEQLAAQLGVGDRVIFHGHVDDDRLREIYSGASVFAIASVAELQSIATMEAMASALPIVAADAMALPHLVRDGVNGYLFPPGDAQALADRLDAVLAASPDERRRMQQASLDGVIVHDINRTLDTFEALYRGAPPPE